MKIEAGKKYVTRDGRIVGPMRHDGSADDAYPWEAAGEHWLPNGAYLKRGGPTVSDLVAEYVEPVASLCGGQPSDAYAKAAEDALDEVRRARSLFPGDFNTLHEGMSITREEFEELWDICKQNQKIRDPAKARKEAIQLAAMALRVAVECCHEPVIRK